jgi:hypothetical protein
MMDAVARDIPEPENFDIKEVYAFMGLATYAAQVLEKSLVNLLAFLYTDGLLITQQQFDTIFDRYNKKTFGQLVQDARTKIQIPDSTEALLGEALPKRNWLVHGFFADHAVAFGTAIGRRDMIETLRSLTGLFERADREVTSLYYPILQRRGASQDSIAKFASEMVANFSKERNSQESE